jgi:hypothetical protein
MGARRLLVLLALTGLAALESVWSAPSASAESADVGIDHDGGAPDINAGPATVVEGASVTVGLIAVAPPSEIGAWQIDVHYNDALLDATACVSHPAGVCNDSFSATEVRSVGADITGIGGTAELAAITFEALGGPGSCSALGIEVMILVEPDEDPIDPVITNGAICIVGCADITGDGFVGVRDVVRLFVHVILGRPYDAALDLNADGDVDAGDVVLALQQLGSSC